MPAIKVGFISDLHIDRNVERPPEAYLKALRLIALEKKLNVLVYNTNK